VRDRTKRKQGKETLPLDEVELEFCITGVVLDEEVVEEVFEVCWDWGLLEV
jgi:hypothetical protein